MKQLDPKSVAGILLREHDNAEQALAYAERKARTCPYVWTANEYRQAAEDLREYIKEGGK